MNFKAPLSEKATSVSAPIIYVTGCVTDEVATIVDMTSSIYAVRRFAVRSCDTVFRVQINVELRVEAVERINEL